MITVNELRVRYLLEDIAREARNDELRRILAVFSSEWLQRIVGGFDERVTDGRNVRVDSCGFGVSGDVG